MREEEKHAQRTDTQAQTKVSSQISTSMKDVQTETQVKA